MTEYRINSSGTLQGRFAAQAAPVIRDAKNGDKVIVDNSVLGQIVGSVLKSAGKADVEIVVDEPPRPKSQSIELS